MSEKMISRRKLSTLLGIAAALGFALPATVLRMSDAEAQGTTAPATTPAPSGTQRRQARRTHRTERRQERRKGRTERRTERRTGRKERREERHTPKHQ